MPKVAVILTRDECVVGCLLPSQWPDRPYSLERKEIFEERIQLLGQPHIRPLTEFTKAVASELDEGFPSFDPLDGGITASVLVLFETPGPRAVGTRFVSRNNPDPSARNTFNAFQQHRIPRAITLLWNVAPWFISATTANRNATAADIRRAAPYTMKLIAMLPHLKAVMLMGLQAQRAERYLDLAPFKVLRTFHTGAQSYNHVRCREDIHSKLADMRGFLTLE